MSQVIITTTTTKSTPFCTTYIQLLNTNIYDVIPELYQVLIDIITSYAIPNMACGSNDPKYMYCDTGPIELIKNAMDLALCLEVREDYNVRGYKSNVTNEIHVEDKDGYPLETYRFANHPRARTALEWLHSRNLYDLQSFIEAEALCPDHKHIISKLGQQLSDIFLVSNYNAPQVITIKNPTERYYHSYEIVTDIMERFIVSPHIISLIDLRSYQLNAIAIAFAKQIMNGLCNRHIVAKVKDRLKIISKNLTEQEMKAETNIQRTYKQTKNKETTISNN